MVRKDLTVDDHIGVYIRPIFEFLQEEWQDADYNPDNPVMPQSARWPEPHIIHDLDEEDDSIF